MVMILPVAVNSIFLYSIESLVVQLEEFFSIFPMQGFCNKIYDNSHEIIGWDPNKGNNNFDGVTAVMSDESDVDTVGGRMLEMGVKTYLPIHIIL